MAPTTYTQPLSYPIDPATISGTSITVDLMLQEPTRINQYLSDMAARQLFSDRIFSTPGSVTGGALIYDQLDWNDYNTTREVQNVEPGAEFPIVTTERKAPKIARVEKYGGKFFITDEARDRNDQSMLQNEARKLANNIALKTDEKALAALFAAINDIEAATPGALTVTGNDWSSVVTTGTTATSAQGWPAADFAKSQLVAEQKELGVNYNLWIVNPQQYMEFQLVYGNGWNQVLGAWGVSMISTNRMPAGTALALEERAVGQMRVEKPLTTESWREPETQRTWVQSDVRPLFAVTNPYSLVKIQGI